LGLSPTASTIRDSYTTIDPAGAIGPIPYSINDKGQIAGFYTASDTNHGFLASPTKSGGPNDAPKAGHGVDTFVFAPTSSHDTSTLLDAIQHPQSELANLQHATADTVSTHDAHDTITLPDVHASNLHSGAFHLV
jgi:hypothetical protein